MPKYVPLYHLPNGKPVWAENEYGRPICGSKRSRGRPQCKSVAIMANGRCRIHGGSATRRTALTSKAKDADSKYRYAGRLPSHLYSQVADLIERGDVLSLREDLAFTDLRLRELAESIGSLDGYSTKELASSVDVLARRCKYIKKAVEDLAADADPDDGSMKARMEVIEDFLAEVEAVNDTVKGCVKKGQVWQQIQASQDHRRKLTESEIARIHKEQAHIPAEKAFALVGALVYIIKANADLHLPQENRVAFLAGVQKDLDDLIPSGPMSPSTAAQLALPSPMSPEAIEMAKVVAEAETAAGLKTKAARALRAGQKAAAENKNRPTTKSIRKPDAGVKVTPVTPPVPAPSRVVFGDPGDDGTLDVDFTVDENGSGNAFGSENGHSPVNEHENGSAAPGNAARTTGVKAKIRRR